eukprot:g10307.t1
MQDYQLPLCVTSSDAARCFWAAATLQWTEEEFLRGARSMAQPLLPQCSEQDLSNMAWACASLGFNPCGWISELVGAYAAKFGNAEEPSSPQAVANVLWSLAKAFEGGFGEQAGMRNDENRGGDFRAAAASKDFLRSLADFLRTARVKKRSDSPWSARFEGLFLSHISILCWSYARVMVAERVTRQLLSSAIQQLEPFTSTGAIKAQEHANLLWAYAEAAEKTWAASMQKPFAMLRRLVLLLCDPKLRLTGESASSFAASTKALARLPLGSAEPQARRWMQAASVRQCKRSHGLEELPPQEVVALINSLTACRSLHRRMMTSALQFLQEEECRHRELRPPQLQMLLDALSLVGLRTNAPEHMWFLQIVTWQVMFCFRLCF